MQGGKGNVLDITLRQLRVFYIKPSPHGVLSELYDSNVCLSEEELRRRTSVPVVSINQHVHRHSSVKNAGNKVYRRQEVYDSSNTYKGRWCIPTPRSTCGISVCSNRGTTPCRVSLRFTQCPNICLARVGSNSLTSTVRWCWSIQPPHGRLVALCFIALANVVLDSNLHRPTVSASSSL